MALMMVDDNLTEELLESIRRAGPGSIAIFRQPRIISLIPEPGEIYPFGDRVTISCEPYDDGGGAAVCRARFGV